MSLTLNPRDADKRVGKDRLWVGKMTFDSSYPTGGESIAALTTDNKVLAMLGASGGGYIFEFDYDNQKLKVMYGDYSNGSDGVLVQVPNETDLSSLIVDITFLID